MRPNAPLVRPADMVLAPESARIATPNTTGVGSAVRLDTDAFTAPARGMAATGQGLQSAADQGFNLEMKRLEAIGINQENEVDMAMTEAEGRIAVELAREPDETKWEGIAARHIEAAKSRAGQINMSRATREAVMPKLERWAVHRGDQVKVDSAEHTIQKAARAANDRVKLSILNGDPDSFEQNLAARRKFGSSNDAQDEMDRLAFAEEAGRKAREARANEVIAIARTEGPEAAIRRAKESGAEPVELESLMSDVRRIERQQVSDTAQELANAVANGELKVPGQVDEWAKAHPLISPEVREQYKAHVARMNDGIEKERARANAPENMSRLVSEIASMDPATVTNEELTRLDLAVASLPQGFRRVPSNKLDILLSRARAEDAPDADGADFGEEILDGLFKTGAFGPYDNGKEVLDKEGKPVIDSATKLPKIEYVRNQEQYIKALNAKVKLGGEFHRWHRANPKATTDEIQSWVYEHAPEGTLSGMFDKLDSPTQEEIDAQNKAGKGDVVGKTETTAITTPQVEANDPPMPAQSGPASNILLAPPTYGTVDSTMRPVTSADMKAKKANVYNKRSGTWEAIPGSKLDPEIHMLPK